MKLPVFSKIFTPVNTLLFSGVIAAFHLGKVSPALKSIHLQPEITIVQSAFLLSLMQVAGALSGVFAGLICSRVGSLRSLLIGHFLLFCASIAVFLIISPSQLLALRAIESVGYLMIVLPTPGLIREIVPASKLSFCLGLWGCFVAIGTSASFVTGPYILELAGWKTWWFIAAVLSALSALLLYLYVNPVLSRINVSTISNTISRTIWLRTFITVLKNSNAWCLGIAFGIYTGQWITIIGFLPVIYSGAGIGKIMAGMLTAAAAFVNILGNVVAAVLMHRGFKKSRILITGYVLIMVMPVFAFSDFTPDIFGVKYIAVLLFSAIGGVIPAITYALVVQISPSEETIAGCVGWVQQLTSIGMLITPPLVAEISLLARGWEWTWTVTCSGALIGMFLSARVATRCEKNLQRD